MRQLLKLKSSLDRKLKKITQTEPSYDLFVAIHDFVKIIESNPPFIKILSNNLKLNREMKIRAKYDYLKQIYQGLEDVNAVSHFDLGHARYAMIKDLNKIQNNELTDNNSLWKRRELSRKMVGDVHAILSIHFSKLAKKIQNEL